MKLEFVFSVIKYYFIEISSVICPAHSVSQATTISVFYRQFVCYFNISYLENFPFLWWQGSFPNNQHNLGICQRCGPTVA